MEYRPLGRSDIVVSAICLGTMTWGEQNDQAAAHRQLDLALDCGVNFIDTAEMYPFPARAETQGRTEAYLGSWLKSSGKRDQVIVATKVTGRATHLPWLGRGETRLDRRQIEAAIDASLRRLGIDHIDLYQLHWPDRSTNFFGRLSYDSYDEDDSIPVHETLSALADLAQAGKIRAIGLSNETPWGAMHFLHLAETRGLPRPVTIQNPYSLLNRTFEIGLAEVAWRGSCGLMAYSALGMGVLSGKHIDGNAPPGARLTLFPQFKRYVTPKGRTATAAYAALARAQGLDPAQMALAFVHSRPFVTSTIIGATTEAQLAANIDSIGIKLSDETLAAIEEIHADDPSPCP
ncbi:MAG: NADP(H)-dependent aldo-keto reductase [Alphaproteobacteria bacterium]|nr:NADP(H)-dependent aldo-keto reductase [Alphaproteobacteria bacterium]